MSITSASDHFDGHRYFMPNGMGLKTTWDLLKWKFTANVIKWPEHVENKTYPLPRLLDQRAVFTWINHSTFLVQLPGLNLLTDPVFSERSSPVSFAGPRRVRSPGVAFENLPAIDVVMVSHNHYDHLDIESLVRLDGKFHPLFLVPLGDAKLLKEKGIANVVEMDWYQEQKVKDVRLVFVPVQHWSARGMFDKNKSLWGGYYVLSERMKFYFTGDAGYSEYFKDARTRYGSPDVALIPIGAYEPRWFMRDYHMNPDDAVMAHKDLAADLSIGMHFGTFQLTDEGIDDPLKDLEVARKKFGVENFRVLDQGESLSLQWR